MSNLKKKKITVAVHQETKDRLLAWLGNYLTPNQKIVQLLDRVTVTGLIGIWTLDIQQYNEEKSRREN